MSESTIVILGRPNVGKSTLFNRLVGERRSIVSPIEGVTRDRIYSKVEWLGTKYNHCQNRRYGLFLYNIIVQQYNCRERCDIFYKIIDNFLDENCFNFLSS